MVAAATTELIHLLTLIASYFTIFIICFWQSSLDLFIGLFITQWTIDSQILHYPTVALSTSPSFMTPSLTIFRGFGPLYDHYIVETEKDYYS